MKARLWLFDDTIHRDMPENINLCGRPLVTVPASARLELMPTFATDAKEK
jgi:hypothetical protein